MLVYCLWAVMCRRVDWVKLGSITLYNPLLVLLSKYPKHRVKTRYSPCRLKILAILPITVYWGTSKQIGEKKIWILPYQ